MLLSAHEQCGARRVAGHGDADAHADRRHRDDDEHEPAVEREQGESAGSQKCADAQQGRRCPLRARHDDGLSDHHSNAGGEQCTAGVEAGRVRIQAEAVLDEETGDDLDEAQCGEHAESGHEEGPDPRVERADMRGLIDQLGSGLPAQNECHHQQSGEQEHRDHVDRHHERDPRQQPADEGPGDRGDALGGPHSRHAAHPLLLTGGDVGDVGLSGREDRRQRRAEEHAADKDEHNEQRRLAQAPADAHCGDDGEERHGRRAGRQGGDENRFAPP